jgi:hypothetical protein
MAKGEPDVHIVPQYIHFNRIWQEEIAHQD